MANENHNAPKKATNPEHFAAVDKYLGLHGPEARRKSAESRQQERALRTPAQQLVLLDGRRGESKKERSRLQTLITK